MLQRLLYRLILTATPAVIDAVQKVLLWLSDGSLHLLQRLDGERLNHELAAIEQAELLEELELLRAGHRLQRQASQLGHLGDADGEQLLVICQELHQLHGWSEAAIDRWLDQLLDQQPSQE